VTLTETRTNDVVVVAVAGKIDHMSVHDFEADVLGKLDAGVAKLVLDLAGCDFINSTGLRVFLVALKRMQQSGGRLALSGLNPYIASVFEIAGFGKIFSLYVTADEAVARLS
jgi:anti-sigma B factor antagonist